MKNKYYLQEFHYFDGDHKIIFNIVAIDFNRKEITVAISNQGKITQQTFALKGEEDELYFEYGIFDENKILVDEFETITEE